MASSARIIAVANCKGGCGKTTTAVNLAAELAARGRRTLLIDLDPQGQASLGRPTPANAAAAHDLLRGARLSLDQVVGGGAGAPDLLPADRGFRPSRSPPPAQALTAALADVAPAYDAILFDTPPAADLPMVAALAAAHYVLTPTQLTPLACDGVQRFAQVFFYVASELNTALRAFAITPIQVDLRTRVQQSALARLAIDFGPGRLFPAIRSDVALAEAFGCGRPARDFRPHSRGATDYARLAERIDDAWLERAPSRVRPALPESEFAP